MPCRCRQLQYVFPRSHFLSTFQQPWEGDISMVLSYGVLPFGRASFNLTQQELRKAMQEVGGARHLGLGLSRFPGWHCLGRAWGLEPGKMWQMPAPLFLAWWSVSGGHGLLGLDIRLVPCQE